MIAMGRPLPCLAAAALTVLVACETTLPSGPSDLTTGIVIYEHANYQGRSAHVTADIKDLKAIARGPCETEDTSDWNDCMSSVRVAPGTRATLYRDADFKGESVEASSDIPNLQLVAGSCSHDGLNDCITSIRIGRP